MMMVVVRRRSAVVFGGKQRDSGQAKRKQYEMCVRKSDVRIDLLKESGRRKGKTETSISGLDASRDSHLEAMSHSTPQSKTSLDRGIECFSRTFAQSFHMFGCSQLDRELDRNGFIQA